MRIYQIDDFGMDALHTEERDIPRPGEREILVKVRAVSLNFRDLMVVSGTYNPRMKLPAVPFSDCAGEIVGLGEQVTRWTLGDRVCSTVIPGWIHGGPTAEKSKTAIGAGKGGVLAEFVTFDEDAIVRMPRDLGFEEASTLPCAALTAWQALVVSGGIRPGETVLTLGTGGVSIFAVQFARLAGAEVIATSSSDEKLPKVKELGAAHTINYRERADWDKAVVEITSGVGVDHVVEVGGTGTLTRSVRSARTGGHIALIGALDTNGEFNPVPVLMKGLRMQGIFVGSRSMFEAMNRAIESSALKPVVDRVFSFEEAAEALTYMKSGSHFGKIVISVNSMDQ